MATKRHVSFGSNQKRFGRITAHPKLDPTGLYSTRPKACDPCLYHPRDLRDIFPITDKNRVYKDPWRSRKELEEWAVNLGYRNQKILNTRKWFNSLGGPAWCEIPDPNYQLSVCNNVGLGRTSRYKKVKFVTPGPGTYYSATPYKVPYGPHSKRPTLDREEPCRFPDLTPRWSLAPNRYTVIDKKCMDEIAKEIVSIRGPYDLFTGKRDMSTIKNHFNTSLRTSAATWPLMLKGSLETYKKSHIGRMNKTNRSLPFRGRLALVDLAMSVKKPDDPGAASYNIDKPKTFIKNKHGFNSSDDKPPGYIRTIVWPGVGRYNPKSVTCGIPGQGHSHVFLSKEKRTMGAYLPEPLNSF